MKEHIHTEEDLQEYLTYLIEILGWGFHPDDPIGDYIDREGHPTFKQDEVKHLENLMEGAFDFCEKEGLDIYELSMDICKNIHGDIFEELAKAQREEVTNG